MKTSKFSDSQIMAILKQGESGVPVSTLCRENGMSSATYYKWRTKFGGMDASLICLELGYAKYHTAHHIKLAAR